MSRNDGGSEVKSAVSVFFRKRVDNGNFPDYGIRAALMGERAELAGSIGSDDPLE
ncbi:MAG: hypothetical protein WEB58_02770 [Planctomycetaceae bacterium]